MYASDFLSPLGSYHYRAFWCLGDAFKISKKQVYKLFIVVILLSSCLALANWTLIFFNVWKAARGYSAWIFQPHFSYLISLLVDSIYF